MTKLRRSALSTVAVSLLSTAALADVPYDQMIAFGVSYEDIGQFPDIDFVAAFRVLGLSPPGAGLDGSTGFRFTNIDPSTGQRARSWIEMLSGDLGIGGLVPSTPILFPGPRTDIPDTNNINFAYGGARAQNVLDSVVAESTVRHPIDALAPPDLTASSPGFLQRLQSGQLSFSTRTLFVVNSGGNDVRDADVNDPTATAVSAAETTLRAIQALVDAGAGTIVVPTFPQLGLLSERDNVAPDGSRTPKAEARNIAAGAFNQAMAQGLPATGGNIVTMDFNNLILEVLDRPDAFGFNGQIDHTRYCYSSSEWSITGIFCTEAAGLGKSGGGDPDDFVLNDGLHPTQAMSLVLSDYAESVLRAPGMIALLPEVALGDARAFRSTVRDYQVRRRWGDQPTGFDLFAAVQGEDADFDDTFATPGASSDAVDLTVGLGYGFGEVWFIGGALGTQRSDVDIDEQGSEFETSGLLGSVFVGYRRGKWFGDLALTAGKSELDDIDRVIPLGSTLERRERGDTEVDTFGASAEAGVDLMPEGSTLRLGPFVDLDYLEVEVDGYSEDGSSSTAMAFGDQERDSLLGSVGVFVSYPFQIGKAETEVYGDLSYRKEFEDDTDEVEAVVKNLASGVHFRQPGYQIDDDAVVVRAGISARMGALRLGLFGSYQDNDRETGYLGLSLAYDL